MKALPTRRDFERPEVLLPVGVLLLAIAAAGCAGPRGVATSHSPALEARLRQEVRTWDGTPHVWGGETRAGTDCSGFVMRVYEDVLGITLPRSTEEQAREGREVAVRALVPGDLIFFRTAPKTRHVGIYLSDGEFAHASSSEGVRVSRLEEDYWQRTYWMSRRVVTGAGAMPLVAVSDASETPSIEPRPAPDEPVQHAGSADGPTMRMGW